MYSEREQLRLADIISNIDRIERYLDGTDREDFGDDQMVVDAVERCLQRVSEAVMKIGETRMAEISPDLPVHAVRGLGNILRHEYDMIDYEVVWNTVKDRLPLLRAHCTQALAEAGNQEG